MSDYTVPLDEPAATDVRLTGGKGASLGRLLAAGFPVPPGFVVTTAAYRAFVDAAGLAGAEPARMREQIPQAAMPAEIAEQIRAGYAGLGEPRVAVRSSGTAEDLADASFAGQHDTYLDITGTEAVLSAVRDCWASLWTERAVAYRSRYRYDDRELALAVVVQRMVPADQAGVLFTADPVSGRRDRIVLEAVRGLGEALVSGTATGEHYVLDKATRTVLSGGAELSASALTELAGLAVQVEQRFGGAQDIEWARADGRFWLVQARPLTALPDEPTGDAEPAGPGPSGAERGAPRPGGRRGRRGRHDRRGRRGAQSNRGLAMAADHMPYPPFTMDVALFVRPALTSILRAIGSAGFGTPTAEEVLVEIDDGVVQIVPPRIRPTARVLLGVPAAVPAVVRLLRTRTEDWRARSDSTLVRLARQLDTEDLSVLAERELMARVLELMHTVGTLLPSRFGAVPAGALAEQLAAALLRAVAGADRAAQLHADLMSAVPCVTTASNAELRRIADTVRRSPVLLAAYRSDGIGEVADRLAATAEGRDLLERIDAYLRDFGFRELSIFTVGLPALRERPEVVHGLITGLVGRDADPAADDLESRFDRARRTLATEPGLVARLLAPLILRLFDAARDSAGFREDSHYQLVMALAVARRVLLELGARLELRGALGQPDEVGYLEPDEIEQLEPERARQLVARRRAARAAALDHYTIISTMTGGDRSADAGPLHGTPASRGTAVGPVRVVHDEAEFSALRAGDVLVCPYTNPTWTPLFSLACAVVADAGGAASHAAIVAREHGIPAVMGTGNGTRVLVDGQLVRVDGDHGTVTPVDAPDRPAAPQAGTVQVR